MVAGEATGRELRRHLEDLLVGIRRFIADTLGVVERTEADTPLGSETAWQGLVSDFWAGMSGVGFTPTLTDRVWTANRCIQLNAQQVASMPLRFHGTTQVPAWVANPDPSWYPNGIGDAVFAAIDSMYRWGDAFLYITARYADGYPSAWTLLDASNMTVESFRGQRHYRSGDRQLDPRNVVQVSRDPRGGLKGTSAIKAYASQAWGLVAASDLSRVMMQTDVPQYALKAMRKVTPEQATQLQSDWMARVAERRGAPPVLPPDINLEKLSFSVSDLMLLDLQQFNAQTIASAFGVPALFLNLPLEGGLTYQSPGMLAEHWWRFELRPMAFNLSRAISAQMLPRGSYVEFDARQTLAPTFKDAVDAWAVLVEKGGVSPDLLQAAVLGLSPEEADPSDFLTPPSAGASPAQQPSTVVALRPAGSQ